MSGIKDLMERIVEAEWEKELNSDFVEPDNQPNVESSSDVEREED